MQHPQSFYIFNTDLMTFIFTKHSLECSMTFSPYANLWTHMHAENLWNSPSTLKTSASFRLPVILVCMCVGGGLMRLQAFVLVCVNIYKKLNTLWVASLCCFMENIKLFLTVPRSSTVWNMNCLSPDTRPHSLLR